MGEGALPIDHNNNRRVCWRAQRKISSVESDRLLESVNYPDATLLRLRLQVLRERDSTVGADRDDKTSERIIAFNLAARINRAGILLCVLRDKCANSILRKDQP